MGWNFLCCEINFPLAKGANFTHFLKTLKQKFAENDCVHIKNSSKLNGLVVYSIINLLLFKVLLLLKLFHISIGYHVFGLSFSHTSWTPMQNERKVLWFLIIKFCFHDRQMPQWTNLVHDNRTWLPHSPLFLNVCAHWQILKWCYAFVW